MAKKAIAAARPLPAAPPASSVETTQFSGDEYFASILDKGTLRRSPLVHPFAALLLAPYVRLTIPAPPTANTTTVYELLQLMRHLRDMQVKRLRSFCHEPDGSPPSQAAMDAAFDELHKHEQSDDIRGLIQAAQRLCGEAGVDHFQTKKLLNTVEEAL